MKMPPSPVIFSLVALAAVAWAAWRVMRHRPKLKALRLGAEGEKAVGQFLERMRESGYQVFHDLDGPGFNVDHDVEPLRAQGRRYRMGSYFAPIS